METRSAINSTINNNIDLFYRLEHKLQLGLKTWGGGSSEVQEGEMGTEEGAVPCEGLKAITAPPGQENGLLEYWWRCSRKFSLKPGPGENHLH